MSDPWIERHADGVLELRLEGFDADAEDEREIRGAIGAMAEDGGPTGPGDLYRRWFGSTANIAAAIVISGIGIGLGALGLLSLLAPNLDDTGAGMLFEFLTFVAGFSVPIAVAAKVLKRRPKELGFTTERFTIRLDSSTLTFAGVTSHAQRFALSEVAEILTARDRLVIVRTDGTKQKIAMSMLAAQRHPELAARLNDAIRGMRAHTFGYRGPRIGADEALPSEEDVEKAARRS